jgi:hypothetical protein
MRNDDGSPIFYEKQIDFRDKGMQRFLTTKSREEREVEGKRLIEHGLDEQYQGRTGQAWKLADRTVETMFYEELKEMKWLEETLYWELKELGEEKFKLMHPDDEFEFFGDKYGGTVVAVDPDVPLMPVQKINDIKRDILDIWGV